MKTNKQLKTFRMPVQHITGLKKLAAEDGSTIQKQLEIALDLYFSRRLNQQQAK